MAIIAPIWSLDTGRPESTFSIMHADQDGGVAGGGIARYSRFRHPRLEQASDQPVPHFDIARIGLWAGDPSLLRKPKNSISLYHKSIEE